MNDESVQTLARLLKVSDMSCGNLGGSTWTQLKLNPKTSLPWVKLSEAPLWQDTKFHNIRLMLSGEMSLPVVNPTAQIQPTSTGVVESVKLNGSDGTAKTIYWGLPACLFSKKYQAAFIELDCDGMPAEYMGPLSSMKECRIILYGNVMEVKNATMKLADASCPFSICTATTINIFLREDPVHGPREPFGLSVWRQAVIFSQSPLGHHHPYVVLNGPMTCSLFKYLVHILDVPREGGALNNFLYLPCPSKQWMKACELATDLGSHSMFHAVSSCVLHLSVACFLPYTE